MCEAPYWCAREMICCWLMWTASGFPAFLLLPGLIVGSAGFCRGQRLPAEPEVKERQSVIQKFADEKLAVWQQRLNLQEWRISVMIAPASDLRPQTVGNIHWDSAGRTAVIRILDPADYHMAWQPMLQDMEFTVVHELIHLELVPLLADLQRNEASRRDEEFAVNHLAEALLHLQANTVTQPQSPIGTATSSAK